MSGLKRNASLNDLRFFPNKVYEDDDCIVSEFKTYDEILRFPIKYMWGFDTMFENDYNYMRREMDARFLSKFDKNEPMESSRKFVIIVDYMNDDGTRNSVTYDMNNMRIDSGE